MQTDFLAHSKENEIKHLQAKKRDLLTELYRVNNELKVKQDVTERRHISLGSPTDELFLLQDNHGLISIEMVTHRGDGVLPVVTRYPISFEQLKKAVADYGKPANDFTANF